MVTWRDDEAVLAETGCELCVPPSRAAGARVVGLRQLARELRGVATLDTRALRDLSFQVDEFTLFLCRVDRLLWTLESCPAPEVGGALEDLVEKGRMAERVGAELSRVAHQLDALTRAMVLAQKYVRCLDWALSVQECERGSSADG